VSEKPLREKVDAGGHTDVSVLPGQDLRLVVEGLRSAGIADRPFTMAVAAAFQYGKRGCQKFSVNAGHG